VIAVVVDVRLELILAPVVERIGEKKATRRAATIIDRHAGKRRSHAARNFAGPMQINDAVEL
jgi:hypothetical protein